MGFEGEKGDRDPASHLAECRVPGRRDRAATEPRPDKPGWPRQNWSSDWLMIRHVAVRGLLPNRGVSDVDRLAAQILCCVRTV